MTTVHSSVSAGNKFVQLCASLVVIATMLHICVNAASRALLNQPLPAANEYITYWYMPLLVTLGFVVATLLSEHIEARLLYDKVSQRSQRDLRTLTNTLLIISLATLTFFGSQRAIDAYEIRETGGVLELTMWPTTFLVPISFLSMLLITVWQVVARTSSSNFES